VAGKATVGEDKVDKGGIANSAGSIYFVHGDGVTLNIETVALEYFSGRVSKGYVTAQMAFLILFCLIKKKQKIKSAGLFRAKRENPHHRVCIACRRAYPRALWLRHTVAERKGRKY